MIDSQAPFALVLASCTVLALAAAAQDPLYRDETALRLPAALAGQCMDAATGDIDGDGDLDLALAMEFRSNLILLNDGSGYFSLAENALPASRHDSEDVEFADFDRDGDLDLVFVSEDDRTDELFLNVGNGRFSDAGSRLPVAHVSNALAVTDVDGDGFPDLLTGNIGINRVLINDGGAAFIDRTAEFWPQDGGSNTQDLELADVDADGDLDIIVGNEGRNQIYFNVDGVFLDMTESNLPERIDETREIRAADLDGDSAPDLVVANVSFVMNAAPIDYVLFNDGAGRFVLSTKALPEDGRNNFTIQAVDLDRDEDLDLLVPDSSFAASRNASGFLALLNDGSGGFSEAESGRIIAPEIHGNGFDIEVADLNSDGSADLFLCNRASSPESEMAIHTGGLQQLLIYRGDSER
ncbi:MAG: VCBS repeat-containing protein [Gammaproteobacteria bacterium]